MSPSTAEAVDDLLAAALQPGQDVVIGQGFGTPQALVDALPRHLDRLQGSRLFVGLLVGDLPELPGATLHTFFPSGVLGTTAGLSDRGALYERRGLYHLAAGLRDGTIGVDVALAQASGPERDRHSLGITVDYIAAAVARAGVVVLETHPAVPRTGTAAEVAAADHVLTVSAGAGPLAHERRASARDVQLANHAAPWVEDGSTLQLGMGPWVGPLAERLATRRGLRVHTGLLGEWVSTLQRAGALSRGAVVATGAAGTDAFYRHLDGDQDIVVLPAERSHDPARLRALPQLRAVNSVLEVDLLGRANSEWGHGGRRGGVAGLADFAGAASDGADGRSIVVMPSTVGTRSRIVASLDAYKVSLPGSAVDVLVTEHGSAELTGRTAAERAQAIIAVAAPEHRARLGALAREVARAEVAL